MSTRCHAFVQVDVFTDRVFGGNPLAVLLDGRGLSDGEMQAIARETNLSETTFVLPPTRADCAARSSKTDERPRPRSSTVDTRMRPRNRPSFHFELLIDIAFREVAFSRTSGSDRTLNGCRNR